MTRTRAKPFQLRIAAARGRRYVPYLRRHLVAAHRLLNSSLQGLSLALVDDETMSDLHGRFMGLAGPTDVLTFPLETDLRGRVLGGEVVVCVPEARRRAGERQTPVERELLLYAVHGMLHLLGFDDRTAAGFRAMHRTEDDILTRLGVGPVFAARAPRRHDGHRRHPKPTAAGHRKR